MNSRTTRRFRALFASLPTPVKRQARQAYRRFLRDPSHTGLQFKLVISDPPTYSARVGIGYRAVGALDGGTVVWFWIGSHAEYDRLLSRL